jgi:hypothetical protein
MADTDVKRAVISWLRTLYTDFLYSEIQALVPRWEMLNFRWWLRGGLMCTLCCTCAIRTYVCSSRDKLLEVVVFVISIFKTLLCYVCISTSVHSFAVGVVLNLRRWDEMPIVFFDALSFSIWS